MVVGLVDGSMVVEVLLHVDDIITVLRKQAADQLRVVGLVTRNFVSLQDLRKTSDVERQSGKFARCWCGDGNIGREGGSQDDVLHCWISLGDTMN